MAFSFLRNKKEKGKRTSSDAAGDPVAINGEAAPAAIGPEKRPFSRGCFIALMVLLMSTAAGSLFFLITYGQLVGAGARAYTIISNRHSPLYKYWLDPGAVIPDDDGKVRADYETGDFKENIKIRRRYYFFNMTNAHQVMRGAEPPHYVILGPYTYKEDLTKRADSVKFSAGDGRLVSYRYDNNYHFLPRESFDEHTGRPLDDKRDFIIIPNPSFLGLIYRLNLLNKSSISTVIPFLEVPKQVLCTALNFVYDYSDDAAGGRGATIGHSAAFTSRPVHEILWGYQDPIWSLFFPFLSFLYYYASHSLLIQFNRTIPVPSPYSHRSGQACPLWFRQTEPANDSQFLYDANDSQMMRIPRAGPGHSAGARIRASPRANERPGGQGLLDLRDIVNQFFAKLNKTRGSNRAMRKDVSRMRAMVNEIIDNKLASSSDFGKLSQLIHHLLNLLQGGRAGNPPAADDYKEYCNTSSNMDTVEITGDGWEHGGEDGHGREGSTSTVISRFFRFYFSSLSHSVRALFVSGAVDAASERARQAGSLVQWAGQRRLWWWDPAPGVDGYIGGDGIAPQFPRIAAASHIDIDRYRWHPYPGPADGHDNISPEFPPESHSSWRPCNSIEGAGTGYHWGAVDVTGTGARTGRSHRLSMYMDLFWRKVAFALEPEDKTYYVNDNIDAFKYVIAPEELAIGNESENSSSDGYIPSRQCYDMSIFGVFNFSRPLLGPVLSTKSMLLDAAIPSRKINITIDIDYLLKNRSRFRNEAVNWTFIDAFAGGNKTGRPRTRLPFEQYIDQVLGRSGDYAAFRKKHDSYLLINPLTGATVEAVGQGLIFVPMTQPRISHCDSRDLLPVMQNMTETLVPFVMVNRSAVLVRGAPLASQLSKALRLIVLGRVLLALGLVAPLLVACGVLYYYYSYYPRKRSATAQGNKQCDEEGVRSDDLDALIQ